MNRGCGTEMYITQWDAMREYLSRSSGAGEQQSSFFIEPEIFHCSQLEIPTLALSLSLSEVCIFSLVCVGAEAAHVHTHRGLHRHAAAHTARWLWHFPLLLLAGG